MITRYETLLKHFDVLMKLREMSILVRCCSNFFRIKISPKSFRPTCVILSLARNYKKSSRNISCVIHNASQYESLLVDRIKLLKLTRS